MFKPPYAEDRTYGGVRGSGEAIASHSLLDSVEHLLLPLGEKVLRLAVVQAVPLSRHRLYDPVLRKPVPVGFHLVLLPLVRMEDPVSCPWELSVQPGKHVRPRLPEA